MVTVTTTTIITTSTTTSTRLEDKQIQLHTTSQHNHNHNHNRYKQFSLIINNVYLLRIIVGHINELNRISINQLKDDKLKLINTLPSWKRPSMMKQICVKKYKEIDIEWCIQNNHYETLSYKILNLSSSFSSSPSSSSSSPTSITTFCQTLTPSMIKPLIIHLKLPSLVILYRSNPDLFQRSCYLVDVAVESKCLDTVKFFHGVANQCSEQYLLATASALHLACCNGSYDIARYLHYHRREGCHVHTMNKAAGNGHLNIVELLHYHRNEGCTQDAMDMAAGNGFLSVVQFLHQNRQEGATVAAMNNASKNGFLSVVQFLHQNRQEGCTYDAIDSAALNGHYEIVLFLLKFRNEGYSSKAISGTVENNHPAILELLLNYFNLCYYKKQSPSQSYFFDQLLIDSIKLGSRMEIVKILLENYSVVKNLDLKNIVDQAVIYNRLEMVMFLLSHPRTKNEITSQSIHTAASRGYLPILEYLFKVRPDFCYPHITFALSLSTNNHHTHVSTFLFNILNQEDKDNSNNSTNSIRLSSSNDIGLSEWELVQ